MTLQTKYMGIELKNPLIIGASNLVSDPTYAKKLEHAGASALVYRSLFEEQIQLENLELQMTREEYTERHAEMLTVMPLVDHAGPAEHLHNLKKVRDAVSIPLFASLNAIYKETWIEYAKKLEEVGVNGIELNFYFVPRESKSDGKSIEDIQIDIVKAVKKELKIPIAVKLSPFYANPLNVVSQMDAAGANAFVLFNRLMQPDIDIETISHTVNLNLSNKEDNKLSLRYAGLLHGSINGSICSNSGIYSSADVIKMILAGADCVQIVSAIYENGAAHIGKILNEMEQWMSKKNISSLNDFKGKLSYKNVNDPFIYKRAQYIDMLMKKSQDVMKTYGMR